MSIKLTCLVINILVLKDMHIKAITIVHIPVVIIV